MRIKTLQLKCVSGTLSCMSLLRSGKRSLKKLSVPVLIDDARKHSRILLVDDDSEALPLGLLRDDGYNLTHWEELDTDKMHKMVSGEFDVIILDIVGVAPQSIAEEDGLGVLKHIKRLCPEQIVIAFSGETFDINQAQFFNLADDRILKPLDYISLTRALDDVLSRCFNLDHYWRAIRSSLVAANVSVANIRKVEQRIYRALTTGGRPNFSRFLDKLLGNADTALRIASIIGRAVEFYEQTA